ncbi:MAG: catalase [Myxococcota bacterium]|nr:catalase [Myxococcota bacterium]
MAKSNGKDAKTNGKTNGDVRAPGGELHQRSATPLTTNQGVPIADDQNTLRVGARGPALLEDFHFLEKMTHFDHERIPERIVHARGSAAHGVFKAYKGAAKYTRAAFLQDGAETPLFTRFSTVAGGAGSVDLPRDVRGFATKFYTSEGIFDLVGNNIPVFFIQDAMKFPDFVHSVKMEPDRGFPQNASAHDTFWDFVSLEPETLHMIMWAMSDRAIPRSYRMMEGFGVHSFRLVDAKGKATFVKWHWRPALGTQSVVWDEACKINGADQDFHRRDLFTAIQAGAFPEWELFIQPISEADIDNFDFDILDATKLIPEEQVPLVAVGKMTLNRWPDNFFAETEQSAFHPGHLVPGIEFSDDPLLAGRIFSYTDTQLKRLGGPNFHEIPINRPKCPMQNFQRDGMARMDIDKGRVSYEPNTLLPDGPRETPRGFATFPQPVSGNKVRERSETFSDHYSQARMFFRSMTPTEQRHIVGALVFELAKVETVAIRTKMLGHLDIIDPDLGAKVADGLGMVGMATPQQPVRTPIDLPPSPALSILAKAPATLQGRKIGALISDGFDEKLLAAVRAAAQKEGAMFEVVAPKVGLVTTADGKKIVADHMIAGGPSVIFDAVVVIPGADSVAKLVAMPPALDWVSDAFNHCKVIGTVAAAQPLLDAARVAPDAGVIDLGGKGIASFIETAKRGRIWAREEAQADKPKPPAKKAKAPEPPPPAAKPRASARR